jgi:hypothetical protein
MIEEKKMKIKKDWNAAKQAGKVLHHLSGARDNKQYCMLQESPAIISLLRQWCCFCGFTVGFIVV